MQFTQILLLSALTGLSVAQISGLPTCAQSCISSSFGSCNTFDVGCICGNKSLISDLSCCVLKACNASDQQATIDFAVNICKTANIAVPTQASCAASGTSTSSTLASTPAPSSGLSTGTPSTGNGTSVSTGLPSTSTQPNAGVRNAGSGLGLGVAVAGLLAAL